MEDPQRMQQQRRFDGVYRQDETTYGQAPSAELMRYVRQCGPAGGRALDLGAGLGRDTLALAELGLHVAAVDLSNAGIEHIRKVAAERGLSERIDACVRDVREMEFEPGTFDVIAAATLLDHIPLGDAGALLEKMAGALTPRGVLFIEVHTTEDPGSPHGEGRTSRAPVSETAGAVVHYFHPNELLGMVSVHLRVIRYEERREWDATHGKPHQHGKAVVLAVRPDAHPMYYGEAGGGS